MRTALVTGASRGVGRGIALALAEHGFRVFGTGRTIESADLPDTIIRIRCDHLRDEDTAAALNQVAAAGHLNLLVNNAWSGYERMVEGDRFTWTLPFWEQPMHRWTGMIEAGVRAAFVTTAGAVRVMLPERRGLIVNISFWAAQ